MKNTTTFNTTLYNEYGVLKIGCITFDDVTPNQFKQTLEDIKAILCEYNFPTCAEIESVEEPKPKRRK